MGRSREERREHWKEGRTEEQRESKERRKEGKKKKKKKKPLPGVLKKKTFFKSPNNP